MTGPSGGLGVAPVLASLGWATVGLVAPAYAQDPSPGPSTAPSEPANPSPHASPSGSAAPTPSDSPSASPAPTATATATATATDFADPRPERAPSASAAGLLASAASGSPSPSASAVVVGLSGPIDLTSDEVTQGVDGPVVPAPLVAPWPDPSATVTAALANRVGYVVLPLALFAAVALGRTVRRRRTGPAARPSPPREGTR